MFGKEHKIDDKVYADKYCDLLVEHNISIVAINLDQIFRVDEKQYGIDDHGNISDNDLKIIDERKSFFINLFNVLMNNDYFKIAIIINLHAVSDPAGNKKSLYDIVAKTTGDVFGECKKYFNDRKYSDNLLKNPRLLQIIGGGGEAPEEKKIKNKIMVVPQINYDSSEHLLDAYDFYKKFVVRIMEREVRFYEEYIPICAFIEDIFKIPVHECMFISESCDISPNLSYFYKSKPHINTRINNLAIHNFTNEDLMMYGKKFKKNTSHESLIDSAANICVVMDETLMSSEQLEFAKCLVADSIVVLTDSDSDKWKNGLLYRNRKNFLSKNKVATHVVAVAHTLLSK